MRKADRIQSLSTFRPGSFMPLQYRKKCLKMCEKDWRCWTVNLTIILTYILYHSVNRSSLSLVIFLKNVLLVVHILKTIMFSFDLFLLCREKMQVWYQHGTTLLKKKLTNAMTDADLYGEHVKFHYWCCQASSNLWRTFILIIAKYAFIGSS